MSNKRLIILSVLLLIVGGFIFSQILGDKLPKSSSKSDSSKVADRQTQIKNLKAAGADIAFSSQIVIDKTETPEELTAIKAQCSKADSFAKQASAIKFNDDAIKSVKTDSEVFAKGCARYAKKIDIILANTKFADQRKALLSPGGTDICDNPNGCLAPEKFAEYKKLFQEEIELSRQASQSLKNECTFPELKTVCDLTADYFTKKLVLDLAYDKSLNGTDNTAESAAYSNLKFPTEEICAEVRRVTGAADITKNCSSRADQAIAARYESQIAASLAKL